MSILAIYIRLYFIIYKAHRGTISDEEVSVVLNVMPIGTDGKPSKRDTQHTTIKLRNDAKALKRVRPPSLSVPVLWLTHDAGLVSHDAVPACLHAHLDHPDFDPDLPRHGRWPDAVVSEYPRQGMYMYPATITRPPAHIFPGARDAL